MTLSEIDSYITFKTNDSTSSFTAAQRLASINKYYHKVQTMILASSDGWDYDDSNKTDYPVLTTNLAANSQDYILPLRTLKVKRVEITYDGTNWVRMNPFDVGQDGNPVNTSSITSDYSTDSPMYDLNADALFLYPIPTANVTNGLRIWVSRGVDSFTSAQYTAGTLEPGLDEQFHSMLPIGAAYDYVSSKPGLDSSKLWIELQDYEMRLRKYYGDKHEDQQFTITSAYSGNYGK